MSLRDRLVRDIRESGPITVADYVTRCLHDPQDGYYATRPKLGAGGDFITAPLISQMFGELIGLWAVETWHRLGAPDRFHLIEVGPGDGTLMSDALRAAHADPAFIQAMDLVLIEPSAPLRDAQARMLANGDVEPRWVRSLEGFEPDSPVILIANEVLDCLPARQYVRTDDGWAERRVGVSDDGELVFGHARIVDRFVKPEFELVPGQVFEVAGQQAVFGEVCGRLVGEHGGAALLIDYGRDRPEAGDTLQALVRHEKVDPLSRPGEADVTMWADFPMVLNAALKVGADVTGCRGQGDFLRALGIETRAARLAEARPDAAPVIGRQLERLTAANQMGELFKVACVFSPRTLEVPGFEA